MDAPLYPQLKGRYLRVLFIQEGLNITGVLLSMGFSVANYTRSFWLKGPGPVGVACLTACHLHCDLRGFHVFFPDKIREFRMAPRYRWYNAISQRFNHNPKAQERGKQHFTSILKTL